MEFEQEDNKIYCKDEEDKIIAEVTFPNVDENTYNINHTYVVPELRGRKIADNLIREVVEKARREHKKIIPSCSYALTVFTRKKEYEDVWDK